MSRQNHPRSGPLVGIWWDDGQTLAALPHPITANAEVQTGYYDSNLGHADEWPWIAGSFGMKAQEEYYCVPRGRVLVRCRDGQGMIYHGSATSLARLEVIAQEFKVLSWKHGMDFHYEVGDAADALFDDEDVG
jgi:hypothetical protein